MNTGAIRLAHTHLRSIDLNQFQFAAFLSLQNQPAPIGAWSRKWHTPQRCHDDFVEAAPGGDRPPLRAVWCARAYREFEGLYDVWVMTITQDRSTETLISRLSLQGITYDNAITLTQRFLEAVRWKK